MAELELSEFIYFQLWWVESWNNNCVCYPHTETSTLSEKQREKGKAKRGSERRVWFCLPPNIDMGWVIVSDFSFLLSLFLLPQFTFPNFEDVSDNLFRLALIFHGCITAIDLSLHSSRRKQMVNFTMEKLGKFKLIFLWKQHLILFFCSLLFAGWHIYFWQLSRSRLTIAWKSLKFNIFQAHSGACCCLLFNTNRVS